MGKIQNLLGKGCGIVCVAFLICGLLLTGCTPAAPEQTIPTVTGSVETPDNTAALETTESSNITESSQATESPQATEKLWEMDDSAVASLVSLRQALVGTPQQFAVAYFGYAVPDGNMPADPYAVMAGIAPQLCENLPFLVQIPRENIVGTDGNLFCVVPTDENATVAVNWTPWDEATETYGETKVLYRSETGDPFLLMTTNTAWCLETEVIITDSSGEVMIWYPLIGGSNRIAPLCDDNGTSLYYDFSPYDRLNYENLIGGALIEMVGTWELTWTEVEGDRVESAPGGCTVEITTDGMGFFWLSYMDKNYPEDNFYDRELLIVSGELYSGCGNNQWFAEVYTPGDERISYAVTLLYDGTLLMQYSWEMDGMPMVSYGWYKRLA